MRLGKNAKERMGKKKQFKNIINGLLCSFISRNNDVNGYWGIGKLYSLMVKSESLKIEIDLINKTISPNDNEFKLLVSKYSAYLFNRMKVEKIDKKHLIKATVILIGYPNNPILSLGILAPHKIHCRILIIDSLNTKYALEKNVWCREHNPKLESKRAII